MDEAQAYYERSLQIQERAFGNQSPRIADVLNNLGLLHQAKGEYAAALDSHERALAIRGEALGEDDLSVVSSLVNLGYLLRYVGFFARATPLLERALEIQEKALGPDHPRISQTLVHLGIAAGDQGHYEEARQYFRRNLSIVETGLPEGHPDLSLAIRLLANMSVTLGEYAAAESLIDRWRRLAPEATGPLFELARIRMGQGDREEADSLLGLWLETVAAEHGPDSPEYAYHQARTRAISGDGEGALELLRTAVARGYADPVVTRNREFELIFGDPRFQEIVEVVQERSGIMDLAR